MNFGKRVLLWDQIKSDLLNADKFFKQKLSRGKNIYIFKKTIFN